mgnify:CR=1 FL=1
MIKLYDTRRRQKVDFEPVEPGKVSMYVCGPTVYNRIHIGNARTFISFDMIRRYLTWRGFDVTFVQNVTDVDDKIIKRAGEEARTAAEVAEEYTRLFIEDMRAAGVQDPDIRPKATEEIGTMIALIERLIERGHAYVSEGDVYFDVRSYPGYGQLSGRDVDEAESGHRELRADGQGLEERKRDELDFALGKAAKPGEPAWESPWGQGRPGWHTECAAMVHRYLGTPIDIHGGGSDLAFPHHENECAQATCAWHQGFSNTWMHTGMLLVDGEKMSKSLGNVRWAKDLIAEHGGNVIRWMMLSAHYRAPLNMSDESLETSHKEYERAANSMKQGYVKLALAHAPRAQEKDEELYRAFLDAMEDDLNTPNAFAAVFEACKQLNTAVRQREPDLERIAVLVRTMEKMMEVLGIDIPCLNVSDEDCALYGRWREAVKAKNFEQADVYRAQLMEKGIL